MTTRNRNRANQDGVALLAVLGLTVLVLGLAGATFGLFTFRAKRARFDADVAATRQLADDSFRLSRAGLSALVALAPQHAPRTSYFFLGGDRNGDRITSRASDVRLAPNGSYRRILVDRAGNIVEGPSSGTDPNSPLPTVPYFDEDVGVDGLVDELEDGFHPVRNPDPNRDNYHPLFNPGGTESNGIQDTVTVGGLTVGDVDVNGNGAFETEEDAGGRWLRVPGRLRGLVQNKDNSADGIWSVRASDVNNGIDINGPEVLTARLLNNLFRLLDLEEATANEPAEVLGHNQRGFEANDNLDFLLRTSIVRLQDFNRKPIDIESPDPDAVKIIKARRTLPGGRFESVDQLLEIAGPRHLGLLTLPMQEDLGNLADPNDDGVNDIDEFKRLRPFLSVHSIRRRALIRQSREPGDVGTEMRAFIPLNTAPFEVLAAAIMAAFDPLVIPSGGPNPVAFDKAARFLARFILNHRLGIPFPPRPSGAANRSTPGPFRHLEDFQEFMIDFRNLVRNDTSNAARNDILLRNFDNIILQFSENQVFQDMIPDRVQDAPVDKSSLALNLSTTPATYFPTGSFRVQAHSRVYVGEKALAAEIKHQNTNVRVGGQTWMRRNRFAFYDAAGDRMVRRFDTVVKVAEMLHHTTQSDFEGQGATAGHHIFTRSYPERIHDAPSNRFRNFKVEYVDRGAIPGNITDVAFDQDRGIAYYLSSTSTSVFAMYYGRGDLTPLMVINTLPPGDYIPGHQGNFIELDPGSEFGEMGRLYIGRRGRPKIHVYDLSATVPDGLPMAVQRPPIDLAASPIADHPDYQGSVARARVLGLVPYPHGRGFFIAVENNARAIVRFMYPRVDTRAHPEEDDPATPQDERSDGVDNDFDGVVDDRPGTPAGRPEGDLFDMVDNDGDGVADDGAEKGLTAALPLLPPVDQYGLAAFPTDWVYDRVLNQFIVTNGGAIQRFRGTGQPIQDPAIDDPGLREELAIRNLRNSGVIKPDEEIRDLAVDPGSFVYVLVVQEGSGKSRVLKLQAERLVLEDDMILTGNFVGFSLAVDPINQLIFVAGSGKVRVLRNRGSLLEHIGTREGVGSDVDLVADPKRRLLLVGSRFPGRISLYSYTTNPVEAKHLDKGGQVKLAPVSGHDSARRRQQHDRQFLCKADFDNDLHMRRPATTPTQITSSGSSGTPRITGQLVRVQGAQLFENEPIVESVFHDDYPPRMTPDGLTVFADNLSITDRGVEALWYRARQIFGSGAIITRSNNRGLLVGGIGMWMKFDGMGVGDRGRLNIDPDDPPNTVDLFRMFHRVKIDPNVFLDLSVEAHEREQNETISREEALRRMLGEPVPIARIVRFRPPLPEYMLETRFSLRQFQDTNLSGDIDTVRFRGVNHQDLRGETVTVTYEIAQEIAPGLVQFIEVTDVLDPIRLNLDISYRPSRPDNLIGFRQDPPRRVAIQDGGEWIHFATLWGPRYNFASNQFNTQGRYYINGKALPHDGEDLPIDPAARPEKNRFNGIDDDRDSRDIDGDGSRIGAAEGVDEGSGTRFGLPETLDFGNRISKNLVDDDGDGVVDDGYSYGQGFVTVGIVPTDPRPREFLMKAILDDLVFYRNENVFTPTNPNRPDRFFPPRRFKTRGETPDFDIDGLAAEGEPFADLNRNGVWDNAPAGYGTDPTIRVSPYYDRNGNGIHDPGEPFRHMYPFDFGERLPGEPFVDLDRNGVYDGNDLTIDPGTDFESRGDFGSDADGGFGADNTPGVGSLAGALKEFYEDRNENGRFDGGEFYWDALQDYQRNGPEPYEDFNFSGTYDGAGKFIREFDHTLVPGDRVAWMAIDGILPEGTALVPELLLKSASDQVLNHFFGDRRTIRSRRVGFLVGETARLEYRVNFMIPRDAGIYEPFRAGDGEAGTIAVGDDLQIVPFGARVSNGQRIIGPGPNGVIDTPPAAGDRYVLPYQSPILESVTVAVLLGQPEVTFVEQSTFDTTAPESD